MTLRGAAARRLWIRTRPISLSSWVVASSTHALAALIGHSLGAYVAVGLRALTGGPSCGSLNRRGFLDTDSFVELGMPARATALLVGSHGAGRGGRR